jgi:type II secretory pathway pseudopilin PulG
VRDLFTDMPSSKTHSPWPAVIIILLAVVAPITIGTLEMRIARNSRAETGAIQNLEAIANAEREYRQANGAYTATLDQLNRVPPADPYYQYEYRKLSNSSYTTTAAPREPGKHGKRFFYVDQTGVVRYELLHQATATSPAAPLPKESDSAK